jgi:hypothetical protein
VIKLLLTLHQSPLKVTSTTLYLGRGFFVAAAFAGLDEARF